MALTGMRRREDEDGAVFRRRGKGDMNARQQWVTGLMAALMLGTLLMMPTQPPRKSEGVRRQAGTIVQGTAGRPELAPGQVRDFTYD
jgi:hypothetical protein